MKTRLEVFAQAVFCMREAQKVYQRLRQERAGPAVYGPAFKEARRLEREVDGWLVAFEKEKEQAALFE